MSSLKMIILNKLTYKKQPAICSEYVVQKTIIIIIIIIIILLLSLQVFHTSISWWSFTGVWVTTSLLKSPGLFSVFYPI